MPKFDDYPAIASANTNGSTTLVVKDEVAGQTAKMTLSQLDTAIAALHSAPAIANADGTLTDLTTKFNALLAALRNRGLIS